MLRLLMGLRVTTNAGADGRDAAWRLHEKAHYSTAKAIAAATAALNSPFRSKQPPNHEGGGNSQGHNNCEVKEFRLIRLCQGVRFPTRSPSKNTHHPGDNDKVDYADPGDNHGRKRLGFLSPHYALPVNIVMVCSNMLPIRGSGKVLLESFHAPTGGGLREGDAAGRVAWWRSAADPEATSLGRY